MRTLDDAWAWYKSTATYLGLMKRLGDLYWRDLPWEGKLGRDDRYRLLEAGAVTEGTQLGLDHLDDLAVLVLFSVFEATVRHQVLEHVGRLQATAIQHPFLAHGLEEMRQAVMEGSFFRVLESFKSDARNNLIEEVNQVRKYRNWVAHGRRGDKPVAVDPRLAYDRLNRFLQAIANL